MHRKLSNQMYIVYICNCITLHVRIYRLLRDALSAGMGEAWMHLELLSPHRQCLIGVHAYLPAVCWEGVRAAASHGPEVGWHVLHTDGLKKKGTRFYQALS